LFVIPILGNTVDGDAVDSKKSAASLSKIQGNDLVKILVLTCASALPYRWIIRADAGLIGKSDRLVGFSVWSWIFGFDDVTTTQTENGK
jgi:hypothetical protein